MGLNEDVLRKDFSQITYGERIKLLKIINNLQTNASNSLQLSVQLLNDSNASASAESSHESWFGIPNQSLGTIASTSDPNLAVKDSDPLISFSSDEQSDCVLEAYVDTTGRIVRTDISNHNISEVEPGLSASFLKKRKPQSKDNHDKKRKKVNHQEVAPLDVLSILRKTEAGRKVETFIKEEKWCDLSHQILLMRLLHEAVTADQEHFTKHYPGSLLKLSMAKGIVIDFPELQDEGLCPWASWLKIVNVKFETVRQSLPKEQRKNKPSATTSSKKRHSSNANSPFTPVKSHTSASLAVELSEPSCSSNPSASTSVNSSDSDTQKAWLRDVVPNSRNKHEISQALEATYANRRKWINDNKPSCTEIVQQYKPIASFEGEMISEEFARMEKLHVDLVSRFVLVAPAIVQHASRLPKINLLLPDLKDKYDDVCLQALLLLPKLLVPTMNPKTTSAAHIKHVKQYRSSIDAVPTSALLQIQPAGTDIENYQSVESNPEDPAPTFPFILWTTNNQKDGKLYLKIDKLSFLVGCIRQQQDSGLQVLRAVYLSLKAHYVFNLEYHPSLKPFYDYLEVLAGINSNPLLCVSKLITALRNLD